jgi:hypothetical protein
MPTKYPSRMPTASFGTNLFALLVKASRERVEVPVPTWALGVRLQQRIHMLRASMRREAHEKYLIVSRVRTSLLWGERAGLAASATRLVNNTPIPTDKTVPALLVLQPHDAEFDEIIRNAGIDIEPLATSTVAFDTQSLPAAARPKRNTTLPDTPTLDEILNSIGEE